jgi:hypothetical protein
MAHINVAGPIQMISEESEFFSSDAQGFIEKLRMKFSSASTSYAVISIVGPQSSGNDVTQSTN